MTDYPTNPTQWQVWIEERLQISQEEGMHWTRVSAFPIDRLIEIWKEEFTEEQGYVPAFIPALTRNVKGLLRWVYCGDSEPNWKGSDN